MRKAEELHCSQSDSIIHKKYHRFSSPWTAIPWRKPPPLLLSSPVIHCSPLSPPNAHNSAPQRRKYPKAPKSFTDPSVLRNRRVGQYLLGRRCTLAQGDPERHTRVKEFPNHAASTTRHQRHFFEKLRKHTDPRSRDAPKLQRGKGRIPIQK